MTESAKRLTHTAPQTASGPASARKKTYDLPSLRVFGTVTALTAQFSRDKGSMDGGPNNLKT
jgi:hypothetical protein